MPSVLKYLWLLNIQIEKPWGEEAGGGQGPGRRHPHGAQQGQQGSGDGGTRRSLWRGYRGREGACWEGVDWDHLVEEEFRLQIRDHITGIIRGTIGPRGFM